MSSVSVGGILKSPNSALRRGRTCLRNPSREVSTCSWSSAFIVAGELLFKFHDTLAPYRSLVQSFFRTCGDDRRPGLRARLKTSSVAAVRAHPEPVRVHLGPGLVEEARQEAPRQGTEALESLGDADLPRPPRRESRGLSRHQRQSGEQGGHGVNTAKLGIQHTFSLKRAPAELRQRR